jgi:hypothetical protein
MAFRESLIAACTDKAKALGRRLVSMEVVELACECHAKATKEKKRAGILPDAEQVYALYPRKVGREDALTAISLALKKHELSYLLDKTNQFAEAVRSWPSSYRYFQDGGDRCPNPGTWYRQGRFADDPSTWRRHGAHTAAPVNRVIPKEPDGWREEFPDFLHADKPWAQIDDASRQHIILTMAAKQMTAPLVEDAEQTRLRQA